MREDIEGVPRPWLLDGVPATVTEARRGLSPNDLLYCPCCRSWDWDACVVGGVHLLLCRQCFSYLLSD